MVVFTSRDADRGARAASEVDNRLRTIRDCSSNKCYFLSFSSESWSGQVTAKSTTIFQFNLKRKIDTKRIEEIFASIIFISSAL